MIKIIVLLFIFSPVFSYAAAIGKVAAINGKVTAKRNGNLLFLKSSDLVYANDQLATGNNSLLLIFLNNGSSHKMGANSRLILHAPTSSTVLEVLSGSLFSFFKKSKDKSGKKKHYRIKTRTMIAGVRGTQFFTSYGSAEKQDDNWLCVNEGLVEVSMLQQKKTVLVKAGEGISVSKAKGISKPKPLPWTKKLNWNMKAGVPLENSIRIEEAYTDLLDIDYD